MLSFCAANVFFLFFLWMRWKWLNDLWLQNSFSCIEHHKQKRMFNIKHININGNATMQYYVADKKQKQEQ